MPPPSQPPTSKGQAWHFVHMNLYSVRSSWFAILGNAGIQPLSKNNFIFHFQFSLALVGTSSVHGVFLMFYLWL